MPSAPQMMPLKQGIVCSQCGRACRDIIFCHFHHFVADLKGVYRPLQRLNLGQYRAKLAFEHFYHNNPKRCIPYLFCTIPSDRKPFEEGLVGCRECVYARFHATLCTAPIRPIIGHMNTVTQRVRALYAPWNIQGFIQYMKLSSTAPYGISTKQMYKNNPRVVLSVKNNPRVVLWSKNNPRVVLY